MVRVCAGLFLGLLIGVGCRWFDIPLPGPPKLVGVLIIASITIGYMAADKVIATRFSAKGPALTRDMCAGPTGEVVSKRAS
jgi:XapX domain-containing protein